MQKSAFFQSTLAVRDSEAMGSVRHSVSRLLRQSKLCLVSRLLGLILAIVLAGSPAHALVGYTVTDLGTFGGNQSVANGINALGWVTGAADVSGISVGRAFLFHHGQLQDLGTLAGRTLSEGFGINNLGWAAGYSESVALSPPSHAFLYRGGQMQDLGTLGGTRSQAAGINDLGQVVGDSGLAGNATFHAFLYDGSQMHDLGTLGGTSSHANGINDFGWIVGTADIKIGSTVSHAFIYHCGQMHDLGTLGGSRSLGEGINNLGWVVGGANTAGDVAGHAFLYHGSQMHDLGTLGGDGVAHSINDLGWIVGTSFTGNGAQHAFLYRNGQMQDLNNLIAVNNSGWVLNVALGINDFGQIVGWGGHNGHVRGFLLTPAPFTLHLWP